MHKAMGATWVLATASVMLALFCTPAAGYTQAGNCLECHSDFFDGSPSTHDLHQDFTNSCQDCHQVSFSTAVSTRSSANYANYSCNGCHLQAGLVTRHAAAQVSCSCHSGLVGTSAGEHLVPYYYQASRSSIVNPCRLNAANGGEDWNGDGFGLDNDGDGLYDAADSDCEGIVPVTEADWGTLKVLFGRD